MIERLLHMMRASWLRNYWLEWLLSGRHEATRSNYIKRIKEMKEKNNGR